MARHCEIRDGNGTLLAYTVNGEMPQGLTPYSRDEDYVQVLGWRYPAGTTLAAHVHEIVPRIAQKTQECLVVVQGRVRACIYDGADALVDTVDVRQGECLVLLDGGHGYEILDDDTQVIEVKNGPYPGAQKDRRRL